MFKKLIANAVCEVSSVDKETILGLITEVENNEMGDFALPCFVFAKTMHCSPKQVAEKFINEIKLPKEFIKCEEKNGYLNFFVNRINFFKTVTEKVFVDKDKYGSTFEGVGEKCLLEHTSINPNASPHIGRARNAIIGDFVSRLMKFLGYETDVHYFVNDIGKQISMLVLGAEKVKEVTFENLLNLYVQINAEIEENPELEKQVFALLYKLENGDEETRKHFRDIVDTCIKGQTKILGELGINYNSYDYESKFVFDDSVPNLLNKLQKSGLLFEDPDGRLVVNLEKYNLSPLVVTRGDKTSLYPLRDIAYSMWKAEQGANRNIIVLGEDQRLYFKQVSAILKELGYQYPEIIHYSFVLLTDGKMSTRKGTVVLLEDFMKEAVLKAKEKIGDRVVDIDNSLAKSIAYGAVKYSIEKSSNEKNVVFDLDKALTFDGDASPYLQYSYVRILSILNKVDYDKNKVDFTYLESNIEFDLIKKISLFPNVIAKVSHELSPHLICNYIYDLAKSFSNFYHEFRIANEENEIIKNSRICLLIALKQVFENCLNLLGIDLVEKM